MKNCSKCGSVLPLCEFQIRSVEQGTYRNICRECRRQYNAGYYARHAEKYKACRKANQPRYQQRRRELLLEYLSKHPCIDCGESDPVVLELDHVKGVKYANIGDMMRRGNGWKRILTEIAKCVVRCANCHRRKTARDFKWFRGNFGA